MKNFTYKSAGTVTRCHHSVVVKRRKRKYSFHFRKLEQYPHTQTWYAVKAFKSQIRSLGVGIKSGSRLYMVRCYMNCKRFNKNFILHCSKRNTDWVQTYPTSKNFFAFKLEWMQRKAVIEDLIHSKSNQIFRSQVLRIKLCSLLSKAKITKIRLCKRIPRHNLAIFAKDWLITYGSTSN